MATHQQVTKAKLARKPRHVPAPTGDAELMTELRLVEKYLRLQERAGRDKCVIGTGAWADLFARTVTAMERRAAA